MLKPYSELRKVDISRYCMEREGIKYLNWAKCIDILREYGAEEVYFEPIPNPKTGGSLYYTDLEFEDKSGIRNRCYETRIRQGIHHAVTGHERKQSCKGQQHESTACLE